MRSFTLLSLCFLLSLTCQSQSEIICIPFGDTVNVDGLISPSEWDDADSLLIGNGTSTNVFFKHDSTKLLIAFVGNLQSSSRIPEILIDTDNDKNTHWSPDDWWFHISAKDCEFQGQYGNYDNCAITRPNWTAVENMAAGPPRPPFIDTIEVEIPLSSINVNLSDTIGLSFIVTNLFTSWVHWPEEADRNTPSTWGSAVFGCGIKSHEEEE